MLAARWGGWALALLVVGVIAVGARWTQAWFASRSIETRRNYQVHEAKVSDCVWKPNRGRTWEECEERVSRAEEGGAPAR